MSSAAPDDPPELGVTKGENGGKPRDTFTLDIGRLKDGNKSPVADLVGEPKLDVPKGVMKVSLAAKASTASCDKPKTALACSARVSSVMDSAEAAVATQANANAPRALNENGWHSWQ